MVEELRVWLERLDSNTAYITLGSPWAHGSCEPFKGRLGGGLLNGEISYALKQAQMLIEHWRNHCNVKHARSILGYRAPAPEGGYLLMENVESKKANWPIRFT